MSEMYQWSPSCNKTARVDDTGKSVVLGVQVLSIYGKDEVLSIYTADENGK